MAKFLLSLYTDNLSMTFDGVVYKLNDFRHLWTSELIKTLVSTDFFINFSKIISISGSICLLRAITSSFKQINAFFDTLDLKLSIKPSKSKTITCKLVAEVDKISSGWNSVNLLRMLVVSNWTFQSEFFRSFMITFNYF